MDLQKKPFNKFLYIWLNAIFPFVYIAVCEFIIGTTAKGGAVFHGYAPLEPHVYNLAKNGVFIYTIVIVVLIAGLRMSINTGTPSGPLALILKPIVESKTEIDVAISSVLLSLTALCESVTVCGLLLFLVNGMKTDSYTIMLVSVAAMALIMPTEGMLERLRAMRKG